MVLSQSPLRNWRLSVGMTQERLAELAGVSQAHISQVEQGMTPIEGKLKDYLDGIGKLDRKQREFTENMRSAG